jgi:hypothetical protein
MNVGQLIEALQQYPDYWPVATDGGDVEQTLVEPLTPVHAWAGSPGADGNVVVIR